MIQKAQKKPVIVEVCQWTGNNDKEIIDFCEKNAYFKRFTNVGSLGFRELIPWDLYIKTLEGEYKAELGDYIIKGVHGEFYPCKSDIFMETYNIIE